MDEGSGYCDSSSGIENVSDAATHTHDDSIRRNAMHCILPKNQS